MEPILTGTTHIDKDGTVTLPKAILERYGIQEDIDIQIENMPDGKINIIPKNPHRRGFFIDSSPTLLKSAVRASQDSKSGRYVPDQKIDDILDK